MAGEPGERRGAHGSAGASGALGRGQSSGASRRLGGGGGAAGSSPGRELVRRGWCSRSCRPGWWVAPRAAGRTQSRGSHPEPCGALVVVGGLCCALSCTGHCSMCVFWRGGGGVLHCTPSCTGHCSVGVGGVCVAPRVVQGDRVVPQVVQHIAWVGIALHPKMYRAIRCVYGGGGVFALHPKLYRTLQGEGELHCTLSHAGELRCTPGHAGYCLGGGGGDCTAPQAAQCTAAWVGVALRPEPCRALQGLGRGLALLQGCVGGRSSSGAAGEHTGPHTQRWAGGGEQRAWSGSSTAEEGTGRGNGAAPASARCSLMWVGEREREKEGRGKDKKGRREGGTEGRQGRQRMPSRWGLLWPATPGAGCPVNWDLVSPAKV